MSRTACIYIIVLALLGCTDPLQNSSSDDMNAAADTSMDGGRRDANKAADLIEDSGHDEDSGADSGDMSPPGSIYPVPPFEPNFDRHNDDF